MSIRTAVPEGEFQRSHRRVATSDTAGLKLRTMAAELKAVRARERKLLREKAHLLQRQAMLAREFEHRLVNGLQSVVSLLSLQSRAATTVEAAAQLTIAANRVAAFGRVHRRLHLLDHQKSVDFKHYLRSLCDDLSGLLFQGVTGRAVVVTGTNVKLPTALAIPLGFIVNELITNSSKYAAGDITVRMGRSGMLHLLSVSDDGPGLPHQFNPAGGKGLGMKIIRALVREIGGTLQFERGDGGCGTRVTVAFTVQPVVRPDEH